MASLIYKMNKQMVGKREYFSKGDNEDLRLLQ